MLSRACLYRLRVATRPTLRRWMPADSSRSIQLVGESDASILHEAQCCENLASHLSRVVLCKAMQQLHVSKRHALRAVSFCCNDVLSSLRIYMRLILNLPALHQLDIPAGHHYFSLHHQLPSLIVDWPNLTTKPVPTSRNFFAMGFDKQAGISVLELLLYIPSLIVAAVVCKRHGFGRSSGWVFTLILCLVRIIGACCQLATISSSSDGLIEVVLILESVGLSPLLLATLGLLSRW